MATLLPPDMGDRWRHRPVSSLLGWWLTSLVRSIATEVVCAVASAYDA